MNKHTNEAVALAAGLLGQCGGDIASARRSCSAAHDWLCSIDPEYKAPVKSWQDDAKAAGWVSADSVGKLTEQVHKLQSSDALKTLQAKLDITLEAQTQTRKQLDAARARVEELEARLKPAPVVEVKEDKPEEGKTYSLSALAEKGNWKDAEVKADPYAHLPPTMREYARQAAAKLEID